MDKRLNPKRHDYRVIDKTKKGIELVEHRKRAKRKGSVTFHIDKFGNVADIENREFF